MRQFTHEVYLAEITLEHLLDWSRVSQACGALTNMRQQLDSAKSSEIRANTHLNLTNGRNRAKSDWNIVWDPTMDGWSKIRKLAALDMQMDDRTYSTKRCEFLTCIWRTACSALWTNVSIWNSRRKCKSYISRSDFASENCAGSHIATKHHRLSEVMWLSCKAAYPNRGSQATKRLRRSNSLKKCVSIFVPDRRERWMRTL